MFSILIDEKIIIAQYSTDAYSDSFSPARHIDTLIYLAYMLDNQIFQLCLRSVILVQTLHIMKKLTRNDESREIALRRRSAAPRHH